MHLGWILPAVKLQEVQLNFQKHFILETIAGYEWYFDYKISQTKPSTTIFLQAKVSPKSNIKTFDQFLNFFFRITDHYRPQTLLCFIFYRNIWNIALLSVFILWKSFCSLRSHPLRVTFYHSALSYNKGSASGSLIYDKSSNLCIRILAYLQSWRRIVQPVTYRKIISVVTCGVKNYFS